MVVDIDKAGRKHHPGRIDHFLAGLWLKTADRGDSIAFDSQVGMNAGPGRPSMILAPTITRDVNAIDSTRPAQTRIERIKATSVMPGTPVRVALVVRREFVIISSGT